MARFVRLLVAVLSLASWRADAQERHTLVSWSAEISTAQSWDSVRQKGGYNHWKGAAIGGAAGGVAGLLLGLIARTSCSECDPDIPGTALMSAVPDTTAPTP